jgi:hypothetical protein
MQPPPSRSPWPGMILGVSAGNLPKDSWAQQDSNLRPTDYEFWGAIVAVISGNR